VVPCLRESCIARSEDKSCPFRREEEGDNLAGGEEEGVLVGLGARAGVEDSKGEEEGRNTR
jgi:hypothetical protein